MYTLVDLFGFLQFVSGRCVAQYCKAVEKLFVKSQKMGRVEVTSPFEPRYLPPRKKKSKPDTFLPENQPPANENDEKQKT